MKTIQLIILISILFLVSGLGLYAQSSTQLPPHPKKGDHSLQLLFKSFGDTKFEQVAIEVNLKDKALENKEFQQVGIKDRIKDVFTSEGIKVLPIDDIGKPGIAHLEIYIVLNDSVEISTMRYDQSDKYGCVSAPFPKEVYAYKTAADVTASVRKFVKEYIKADYKKIKKINKSLF